jgi:hypothetical protein
MRRIYLQPQIDDLFLSTGVYDPSKSLLDQEENTASVRIDGDGTLTFTTPPVANFPFLLDLGHVVDWQDQLNKRLPKGSSFVTEIAFNGDGVKPAAMDTDTLFQK